MPINLTPGEGGAFTVTITGLTRGLDTQSSPTEITPGAVPALSNVTTNPGYITGMDGTTLHKAGFVAPDGKAPLMLAQYLPETGTDAFLMVCQNGKAYVSQDGGGTWTEIRNSLSTTAWWSHAQIGDYLVMGNGTDAIYKWDNYNLWPLGAKGITGAELSEAATWTGETADATNYVQGIGSFYVESAGTQQNMAYTPGTNLDCATGLLAARDYAVSKTPGTDYYHFQVRFTNTGTIDTATTTFKVIDGSGDALEWPYTAWDGDRSGTAFSGPTLGTWYHVYCKAADATETGTFDPTNVDTFAWYVDTSAGTLRMNVDDVYVIYATTMPPCQVVVAWKNMVLGHSGPDQYYSPVGGYDEFESVDTSVNVIPASETITGAHPYADGLIIATDNRLYMEKVAFRNLLYPEYDFSINELTTEHGCSSHRSMVEAGQRIWMWWRNNVHVYSGINTVKASEIIDPTLADVAPTLIANVVGGRLHDTNQVYFWWPPAGATTNTSGIAYNVLKNAWLPISGVTAQIAEVVYEGGVEYLLVAGTTGRVLRMETGTTWDGTTIARSFTLPWLSAGPPHPMVSWRRTKVVYGDQVSGTLTVEARTSTHPDGFDDAVFATIGTIDQTAATEYGWIHIALRSPWLQLRFSTSGADFDLYWPLTIEAMNLGRQP